MTADIESSFNTHSKPVMRGKVNPFVDLYAGMNRVESSTPPAHRRPTKRTFRRLDTPHIHLAGRSSRIASQGRQALTALSNTRQRQVVLRLHPSAAQTRKNDNKSS
jgi:hypothetical protein